MTATVQSPQSPQAPMADQGTAKAKRPADPRYTALRNFAISISALNVFGYTLLGFEQPWLWPLFSVLVAYATDIIFELIRGWAYQHRPRFLGNGMRGIYEFLLPAHITALAVNMLLYANNQYWPVMFGVVIAVSQKHFLQAPVAGKMRHFMNPSNFGIAATLLLFGSWVSISPPYMFTEWASSYFRLMIPIVILTSGTVINAMLTRRVPLIVGWLGTFFIQGFVRHWLWGVQLNTALSVMTGVAFVLFTNYMITDPGTTPTKPRAQFMFGMSVALVYAALMEFNIVYTLFFATAIVCGGRGLGWWIAHLRKAGRTKEALAAAGSQAPVAQAVGTAATQAVGTAMQAVSTVAQAVTKAAKADDLATDQTATP
jgi:enediyne biosynthesis protein E5